MTTVQMDDEEGLAAVVFQWLPARLEGAGDTHTHLRGELQSGGNRHGVRRRREKACVAGTWGAERRGV